MTSLEALALTY